MITPLLGVIDTAVLTRAGSTADIAGVALAGAVFSVVYWTLGFLRMSLAGLVAQADGRGDEAGVRAHLAQGVLLGTTVGLALLIFRGPIGDLSASLMAGGANTSAAALDAMGVYIDIRLLAAPPTIAFFAGIGWLTGQGRVGLMMAVVVFVTLLNAALDIYFVMELDLGVAGIALGTALAEASGALLLGGAILYTLHQRGGIRIAWIPQRMRENARRILALNADIFLRTFCLSLVFAYFTRAGGQFGDMTVAANQLLMHLLLTAGLMLDGPAIAAETLVGKALGAPTRRAERFAEAVRSTSVLALLGAILLTLTLVLFGGPILALVVPETGQSAALHATASQYYYWAAFSPLFMVLPFQLDGIYIGATRGAALRNSMIGAGVLFIAAIMWVVPMIGNHGLWIAFGVFMLARAAFLGLIWSGFAPLFQAPAKGGDVPL